VAKDPYLVHSALQMSKTKCDQALVVVIPWALAIVIGVLTALTGHYVELVSHILNDLRFGYCEGLVLSSWKRCCGAHGGQTNGVVERGCLKPNNHTGIEEVVKIHWVPWTEVLSMHFFGNAEIFISSFMIYVALSAFMAGVAALLVVEFCPDARGGGIAEVKAAVSGFYLPRSFSGMCLVIKTLGLSLAMGAGLELLADDPLVHVAACLAQVVQRLAFGLLSSSQLPTAAVMPPHELACMGMATGVATAFGTPLGGVLFAWEELGSVRTLGQRALILAFTSSFVASVVRKSLGGGAGLGSATSRSLKVGWATDSDHNHVVAWMSWEMYIFACIGALSGVGSMIFIRLNRWCIEQRAWHQQRGQLWLLPDSIRKRFCCNCSWRPSLRALNVSECMIIALLTSLLNYPLTPLLRRSPTQAIHNLVTHCPHNYWGRCEVELSYEFPVEDPNLGLLEHVQLLVAVSAKTVEAAFIFGSAVPSGVFMPALFIGAALGRFVGNVILMIFQHKHLRDGVADVAYVVPGKFAAVGAVAMLAGFRRMTVSLVVIIFEVTGEYTYIVPFMCAVLTAKLVGDNLAPSVYECHAQLNGYAMIKEHPDVRLEMCLADLAVPLTEDDLIDATKLVPMDLVISCARRRCVLAGAGGGLDMAGDASGGGPDVVAAASAASTNVDGNHVVLSSPMLLLHEGAAATPHNIMGLVRRTDLRKWVALEDVAGADFCRFSQSVVGSGRLAIPGMSCRVLDGGDLVQSDFGVLSTHAPLLTAYCVFSQSPEMQCCVCVDEREPGVFSTLSRDDFYRALTNGQFSLAHSVKLDSTTLANRRMGCEGLEPLLLRVEQLVYGCIPQPRRFWASAPASSAASRAEGEGGVHVDASEEVELVQVRHDEFAQMHSSPASSSSCSRSSQMTQSLEP